MIIITCMHELSVAIGIVNIAEKETQKANKKRVELIELEIGSLSGVELDSLEYVWNVAVKGTVLEGAEKNIGLSWGIGPILGMLLIGVLFLLFKAFF